MSEQAILNVIGAVEFSASGNDGTNASVCIGYNADEVVKALTAEGYTIIETAKLEQLRSLAGAVTPGQSIADIKQHLRTLKQDKADGSRESSAG